MQKKHGLWRPLVWFLIVTTWLADITNHKEVYSKINVFWVYFLSHWPPQLEASSYWNHRHGEPVNPQHNPRTLLASACPAYPAYPEEESIRILGGMVYSLRYDLSQPHDDKDPTIVISLTFCNSWLAMIRSTKHKPLLDLWLGLQMMPVKWYFSRKDKIGQVHDLFVQNWMKETDKVQKTKGGHRAFGSVGSWHPTSSGFNLVAWACCPGARTHDLVFVRCRNKIGEWVSENAGITRHVKLMGWCALPGLQSEVGFKPLPNKSWKAFGSAVFNKIICIPTSACVGDAASGSTSFGWHIQLFGAATLVQIFVVIVILPENAGTRSRTGLAISQHQASLFVWRNGLASRIWSWWSRDNKVWRASRHIEGVFFGWGSWNSSQQSFWSRIKQVVSGLIVLGKRPPYLFNDLTRFFT